MTSVKEFGANELGHQDIFQLDDGAEFGMKIAPQQHRSKVTIENILQCTGELLEEQGFDALSTSMICERAGLTPPALYRYFPNKYAVVMEMAQRVLVDQHGIYVGWIKSGGVKSTSRDEIFDSLFVMKLSIVANIRARQAGKELCQILRTLPALTALRRRVREHSLDITMAHLEQFELVVSKDRARRVLNLLMEVFLVSIELILDDDEADEGADAIRIVCDMTTNQIHKLLRRADGRAGMVAH